MVTLVFLILFLSKFLISEDLILCEFLFLSEINRFCLTLKKIKEEIDKIQSGEFDKIDNPIKNAPHTHVELASNKWNHKYEREEAAYPSEFLKTFKYWPPVARVDNVYGDKNLFCSCPSIDEFKNTAA